MVNIRLVGLTHVLDFDDDDEISLIVFESDTGARLELVVSPEQAVEVIEFKQSLDSRSAKASNYVETNNVQVLSRSGVSDSGEPCPQV